MKTTLTHEQVTAGIISLTSNWATQPFADSVKATWRRKLETLSQGEFQPAFDAWLDGPRSRFRPDVGEFMEIIAKRRGQTTHQDQYESTQHRLAEQRKPVQTSADHVTDVLTRSRAVLAVERKPHADRPEAKAATLDAAKVAFRHYVETADDPTGTAAVDAWRALAAILGATAS